MKRRKRGPSTVDWEEGAALYERQPPVHGTPVHVEWQHELDRWLRDNGVDWLDLAGYRLHRRDLDWFGECRFPGCEHCGRASERRQVGSGHAASHCILPDCEACGRSGGAS